MREGDEALIRILFLLCGLLFLIAGLIIVYFTNYSVEELVAMEPLRFFIHFFWVIIALLSFFSSFIFVSKAFFWSGGELT